MGYRMLTFNHLYEVYRRTVAGEPLASVASHTGWDRKTVRKYTGLLAERSLLPAEEPVTREQFRLIAADLADQPRESSTPSRDQLIAHVEEIRGLINPPDDASARERMRAKSAFRVVAQRHNLSVSYASFKRFAREQGLMNEARESVIRIELPPGREIQLDYGKMGLWPVDGRNRTIYAFCAVLSSSRKPFVQMVTSQNQQSFAQSVVDMFHYYGGVTSFITIDNLKAGVVKPDLWDPQLNRSLSEVAEYYATFVNPARPETPTDKAKVERIVPVVREAFRVLTAVHPHASLQELNDHMLRWCVEDYGATAHGTTRIPPEDAFLTEKAYLTALPEARFEPAVWRPAKVHSGDGFLTFQSKRFFVPSAYRGKQVMVRATGRFVEIFHGNERVRAYTLESGTRVYYYIDDFPAHLRDMMSGDYPSFLLQRANAYGSTARELISAILTPQAYLNARRARGILTVMEKYYDHPDFEAHCLTAIRRRISLPSTFRSLFETHSPSVTPQHSQPVTDMSMARDINYFFDLEEGSHATSS